MNNPQPQHNSAVPPSADAEYTFAPFRVTPDDLLKDDIVIDLDPMPLQLLRYLLANRDRLVSREEVSQKFWQGRAISPAALDAHIHRLREALGDSGRDPKFIATRVKHGYRFIASTTETPATRRGGEDDEDITEFAHATGRWERQPDGKTWHEYNDQGMVIYTFTEMDRRDGFVYLQDPSRTKDKDPGRPMILRLPIRGGMAQWGFPNPLEWNDFTHVWPVRNQRN